jgi:hypothetical protein
MPENKPKSRVGKKFDQGKNRLDLLPWESLEEVGKVLTYGVNKYGEPSGWQDVPDAKSRYEAALLRHLSAHKRGEKTDPESGISHLSHMACNALFLVYLDMVKK